MQMSANEDTPTDIYCFKILQLDELLIQDESPKNKFCTNYNMS